jgi:hypothetical protein
MLALAESLLTRFGIPQGNESLVGDLVEEYGCGRSSVWLWRQTASAIALTVARDIRDHKLLAVRAIATGWVLQFAWLGFVRFAQPRAYVWHEGPIVYWQLMFLSTFTTWPAFVGWVVGRTHLAQQAAMVLLYTASIVAWSIWYFSVHYVEIKHMPIPSQLSIDIQLDCAILVSTLVGGFLQRPRTRFA